MSKAVLISIQPRLCELIASRKKTIEVRKTRPNLETPFKCYIYMTKSNLTGDRKAYKDRMAGKVIGEFVCNNVIGHCEMANADIAEQQGYIKREKLLEYAGDKELYGWHISNLKVYDKPKELSEFTILCKEYDKDNPDCECCDYQSATCDFDTPSQFDCKCNGFKPLTRPPQSWCYVEEVCQ